MKMNIEGKGNAKGSWALDGNRLFISNVSADTLKSDFEDEFEVSFPRGVLKLNSANTTIVCYHP